MTSFSLAVLSTIGQHATCYSVFHRDRLHYDLSGERHLVRGTSHLHHSLARWRARDHHALLHVAAGQTRSCRLAAITKFVKNVTEVITNIALHLHVHVHVC